MSRGGWPRMALFLPGLAVALGAAAATAHGLFEVAAASGVPGAIAWIYPLITDGLAIVAYVATSRLGDAGRGYAWAVVILAAGLSGVAQAMFLAGGMSAGADGAAAKAVPEVLRFGVGAWPAVAAAIVAHLLFMLATDDRTATAESERASAHVAGPDPVQRPAVQPVRVDASSVQSGSPDASNADQGTERPVAQPESVQPSPSAARAENATDRERPVSPAASPLRDRARAEARRHQAQHGALPTVAQLMALAGVSRGTAGTALQELREQPAPLQLITDHSTSKANS